MKDRSELQTCLVHFEAHLEASILSHRRQDVIGSIADWEILETWRLALEDLPEEHPVP